jgi:hypothetical protein
MTRIQRLCEQRRDEWSSVPAQLRQQIERWAETWLTRTFSQHLELRAQESRPFNYPVAVFAKWRGHTRTVVARAAAMPGAPMVVTAAAVAARNLRRVTAEPARRFGVGR